LGAVPEQEAKSPQDGKRRHWAHQAVHAVHKGIKSTLVSITELGPVLLPKGDEFCVLVALSHVLVPDGLASNTSDAIHGIREAVHDLADGCIPDHAALPLMWFMFPNMKPTSSSFRRVVMPVLLSILRPLTFIFPPQCGQVTPVAIKLIITALGAGNFHNFFVPPQSMQDARI
jgi:hypothetical protein